MSFKPAKCPECGGVLQLPEEKDVVKCMYCGVEVIVKQAIQNYVGDNTGNLLNLANTAFQGKNFSESYKYYTKVLEHEPSNAAAWIGKASSAGWMSTLADVRLEEMMAGFQQAISQTPDTYKPQTIERALLHINEVCTGFFNLARNHRDEFAGLNNFWEEYLGRCKMVLLTLEKAYTFNPRDRQTLENIVMICKDNVYGLVYDDKYTEKIGKTVLHCPPEYEKELKAKADFYAGEIQKIDPTYQKPAVKKNMGCFVATATMGDFDHPKVLLLRNFRDTWLLERQAGVAFTEFYYKHSPYFAAKIEKSSLLKRISYAAIVWPSSLVAKKLLEKK